MAKPIKETPVLTGKQAAKFEKAIKRNAGKKVSKQEFDRAVLAFKRITVKQG